MVIELPGAVDGGDVGVVVDVVAAALTGVVGVTDARVPRVDTEQPVITAINTSPDATPNFRPFIMRQP